MGGSPPLPVVVVGAALPVSVTPSSSPVAPAPRLTAMVSTALASAPTIIIATPMGITAPASILWLLASHVFFVPDHFLDISPLGHSQNQASRRK